MNGSEDENFFEDQNESESSEQSEDSKKIKMFNEEVIQNQNRTNKKELIYDNSYLFKKNEKKVELRKEVEDILKGISNNNNNNENEKNKGEKFDKEKFEQRFLESYFKRKKFKKRKKNKKKISKNKKQPILTDQELDEQMYLRRKELYEKEEDKELNNEMKEKTLEYRMNHFFGVVKEMKNLTTKEFLKQFDKYTEFDMVDFKLKRDKEDRIRDFILGLNDYRVTRKVQRRLFDTYIYKEPIFIGNYSPDKNNNSWKENSDLEIKRYLNSSSSSVNKDKIKK